MTRCDASLISDMGASSSGLGAEVSSPVLSHDWEGLDLLQVRLDVGELRQECGGNTWERSRPAKPAPNNS